MKFKRFKSVLAVFISILIIGAVLNMEVSIRQGVNGSYRQIKMPLYAKWTQFLTRHYEYERLAREITKGCRTDREKVLAIFKWTHKNIIQRIPEGMPVVDDHILNIIIRGYGTADQCADVFTTLCTYSGMRACWEKVFDKSRRIWFPLAFVEFDGEWHPMDPYYGKYIRNDRGDIASVDEIAKDGSLIEAQGVEGMVYNGVSYKEFYHNMPAKIEKGKTMRPEKQMPLKRLIFEVKKALHIEEGEEVVDNGSCS